MTGSGGVRDAGSRRQRVVSMSPRWSGPWTGRAGWDRRSALKFRRQEVVLEGLRSGRKLEDACRLAGVSPSAYYRWREKEPTFRVEVEMARSQVARDRPDDRSFSQFRRRYFGMETFVHQAQIVDALDTLRPREIVLVNIWPEAGKTTTFEDWVCQQLALDPNRRIVDLSRSEDLAKKTIGRIKHRMTDVRMFGEFIAAYGPFRDESRNGKPWAATYFTVAKADSGERDYSMQARAVTSAAYGSRIDDLIIDDCQDHSSLSQTSKIFDTLRHTYFTRGRQMRICVIGTRLDRGDVYEAMIDAGIIDRYVCIPAVQPDGTITCPEMWAMGIEDPEERYAVALAELTRIRAQVGERAWWAEYQQMPHSNELATFTDDMLDGCKNHARGVDVPPAGDYVVLSLDPGLGGGNALTCCAHTTEKLVIVDQEISWKMSSTEDIIVGVAAFAARYRPSLLIVERDAMQKHLVSDQRLAEVARAHGFQILPHTTSGKKADPILGVASMVSSFIRGEIDIPYGDDYARGRMDPLLAQLRAWRVGVPAHRLVQDGVMSLWFNWRYWMENRAARTGPDLATAWRRPGLPYQPSAYQLAAIR